MIKKTFGKLAQYPRLRVLVILIVLIVLFLIVLNLVSGHGPQQDTTSLPPSHVQQGAPSEQKAASKDESERYHNLDEQVTSHEKEQAVAHGQTILDNVFARSNHDSSGKAQSESDQQDQSSDQQSEQSSSQQQSENNDQIMSPSQFENLRHQRQSPAQKVSDISPAHQVNEVFGSQGQGRSVGGPYAQPTGDQSDSINDLSSKYRSSLESMKSSWQLPQMKSAAAQKPKSGSANKKTQSLPERTAIKAGTIYFGVIEVGLNSDQKNTPVLARIVSGPFRGAKLMGTFARASDKLVIQFQRMSMPQWNRTISIDAYAVDAQSAHNALATSVNNHYLYRYGMLLASGFLEGFGNAYQSFTYACPPGVRDCTVVGGDGVQRADVTAETAAYQGLGQIGSHLGQVAEQKFNTPPTVKVAQGTGIGVLFMSDLTVSQ